MGLPGNATAALSWNPPADADLAGYQVYRSQQLPVTTDAASRLNTGPVAGTYFQDSTAQNGAGYYYAVTAVGRTGNESALSAPVSVSPSAAAPTGATVRVDFAVATTKPPAGYLLDDGEAFGSRTGPLQGTGLSYGWLSSATRMPVSLEGNGRSRGTSSSQPDPRLATFVHMQLASAANGGNTTPGSWEIAVPNGAYTVTVAVGDASSAVDSNDWITIENQNAIAAFVPTAGSRFATATRTVVVDDGRLTLAPDGGTNTKIDYVDLASFDRAGRPYPSAVTPADGAVSVVSNASVTTDNVLNPQLGAVDETTLGGGNVRLTRVADGAAVPGAGATSGGGDTVSFEPSAPLNADTLYRFDITANVKDLGGRAFLPFSSIFTTSNGLGGGSSVAFDRTDSGADKGGMYTSVVVGPDGKLYAGSVTGQIYRWTINADGTLADRQVIDTVRTHAAARGWEGAPNRTVIGLAFDPAATAGNLILWITDNYAYLGADAPDTTGSIARLTGPDLQNYQEVVVDLPRSIKDHETNSIAFHNGLAYITQGSMTAMGDLDGTWRRTEHLLSAAVLQLDPAKLPAALPLDAATPDMPVPARGDVPAHVGSYDPYDPAAPLTIYASGLRNAFDLVWHSNGHLYAPTNGSAAGGATPASPATYPATCAKRADGGYTGPAVPALPNNQQGETDYVFDVHPGKYYGHPDPLRCEYVLNAGNPIGYSGNALFKVKAYPLGQAADPNYDLADAYDGGLHASGDGSIEYRNTKAFGGALAGTLIVVRYSANQELVAFPVNADGSLSRAEAGITGFTGFKQPLDVAEDSTTGNLYVTELTDDPASTDIQLLKPQTKDGAGKAQVTSRLVYTGVKGGAAGDAQDVVVKNVGGGPLTISSTGVTGTDAALFASSGGPVLPLTLAAGVSVSFPVTFAPVAAGPRSASFQVISDDPATPVATTVLRGLGVNGKGGSLEPSLQWILDTLQIPVHVGDPDPSTNDMPAGSALIGDEVAVSSFTKAETDHAVVVEPVSLFGPDGPAGNPVVVAVGAHTTGNTAQRTALLSAPNSSNQTLLPAVTQIGQYDLTTPFGLDFDWPGLGDRVSYSEDALNTWDPTNHHKVRIYPLKNTDGSVQPNAYLVAPEDVVSPVDFQDAAVIVRNVQPVPAAGTGKIVVTPAELVFSGVRGSTIAGQTVTVSNSGPAPLTVSSVALVGPDPTSFAVTGGAQTIPAGSAATLSVRFAPPATSAVGKQSASLIVTSDDPATPTVLVGLFGLATAGEQGTKEPTLASVVDTLGRPVNVGGTGLLLGTRSGPIGDEVLAPRFVRAGSGPVTMRPVARYSPDEVLPFGWYTPTADQPVTTQLGAVALGADQTLNPATVAGTSTSFDPGASPFGLYIQSRVTNRKSFTQEELNTGIPHAVRVYPAKDRTGSALPNTYLLAFEDASNGDYQDYVFEVTGVLPYTDTSTPAATPLARVDFIKAGSPVSSGYTADTGGPYSDAAGFGWVRQGTGTPVNMSALARLRSGTAEPKLRTLIMMQPTAAQSPNGPGAWEFAVPNGSYVVTVSAGDPAYTDSVDRIQVEGRTAVYYAATAGLTSRAGTVTVQVTDGRLTIDAIGGTNSKLQYVDIGVPPGQGAGVPEIALDNADGQPFADRLVMNRIQTPETGKRCRNTSSCDPVAGPFFPVNVVHEVATAIVRNTGNGPLSITALTVSGPFELVSPPALPMQLAAGSSLSVPVRFTAGTIGTDGGLWYGSLTVGSNDTDEPTVPVTLAGFWQSQSENNQEPTLAELFTLFGYETTVTASGVGINEHGAVHATGDEVLSPYWLRADTSAPVSVRQLAAFHTQGDTATLFWHDKSSTTTTAVSTGTGFEGQSVLPHRMGSTTTPSAGTFTPTGAFGLKIDTEWSDPAKNSHKADLAAGCVEPCGHHLRAWVLRDRSGAVVPNSWLIAMDYSGINYDYNDNLFLVTNMKPETAADPAISGPLPGSPAEILNFDSGAAGTLADKAGLLTGFVSTQPNRSDTVPGVRNSYSPALLGLNTAAPGTLSVTSSGTAAYGTNQGADNRLINGLSLPFDATAGPFSITGRLLGQVSMINAGSEQEGVEFGPDEDNFARVTVLNNSGTPSIEFHTEQKGVGAIVGSMVVIPAPASIISLDLTLLGDPATGRITAAYRLNNGAWTALPASLTLPTGAVGRFFGRQAQAGIVVSHRGGASFVAIYDSFIISQGNITVAAAAAGSQSWLDGSGVLLAMPGRQRRPR